MKKSLLSLLLLPYFAYGTMHQPEQAHKSPTIPSHNPLPKDTVSVILDDEFHWWYSTIDNLPFVAVSEAAVKAERLSPDFVPIETVAHGTIDQPGQAYKSPITPSHGPLQKRTVNVILDAEFLWWYSTIDNLPFVTVSEIVPTAPGLPPAFIPIETKEFDWSWDPGVRIGLGVITNHDGWDVYLDWTYFYNSDRERETVSPFIQPNFSTNNPVGTRTLHSPWGFESDGPFTDPTDQFTQVFGRRSLLFHQFDLELGRKYWISKRLNLRPYTGLRAHWSRMQLNITSFFNGIIDDAPLITGSVQETSRSKQNFWAIGLLGGLNAAWHITHHWSIFSEISTALIYGDYSIRKKVNATIDSSMAAANFSITQNYKHDDLYALQPVLDLALGIRWESTLYDESYRLQFDAGWENHIWWNFNRLDRLFPFIPSYGNLTLSGLVLRGRFEF